MISQSIHLALKGLRQDSDSQKFFKHRGWEVGRSLSKMIVPASWGEKAELGLAALCNHFAHARQWGY